MQQLLKSTALLGDTPSRDYSSKLRLFNVFAQPEIRLAITSLNLTPGMRVLDIGCGTGETLACLHDALCGKGVVAGIDLAAAHASAARLAAPAEVLVSQADLLRPPFPSAVFDVIWSVNTINHLRDPLGALQGLTALLRPGGRIALGQSSFLPDMFFAWDARLERVTNEAVRAYYRDRYAVDERDLAANRALVGVMRRAGLRDVAAKTLVIERIAPLSADDEAYLLNAIFCGTWGTRLQPYMPAADFEQLQHACDPSHPSFALRRRDFHFLQTFTLVVGSR